MHVGGKKRDYDWRVSGMDRAMEAGIDDVGIGVLFGLFDWRFEILALMQHIHDLERVFGVGPHTISVPRLEPAVGSDIAEQPPHPVADVDFRKIVAILRLAVPYTGIIMSTRESADIRRETFALGVSQISAGSRTNPGGYTDDTVRDMEQFQLGDHRSLDEVIRDVAAMGYIPSFCTGCYRLGRTGADFMDLAKPGDIKAHCDPNALSTFLEYLLDYASPETRAAGETLIAETLPTMSESEQRTSRQPHGQGARAASATATSERLARRRPTRGRSQPRRATTDTKGLERAMADQHKILAIHVTDRLKEALPVQQVFTEFGCNIKTRVGLHDVAGDVCAPGGVVILELVGPETIADDIAARLAGIDGVEVKKVEFGH